MSLPKRRRVLGPESSKGRLLRIRNRNLYRLKSPCEFVSRSLGFVCS
jgi:hypothetical protein